MIKKKPIKYSAYTRPVCVQKDTRDFRGKGVYGLSYLVKDVKFIGKNELRKQELYMVVKNDEDCLSALDDIAVFNPKIQVCTYYETAYEVNDAQAVYLNYEFVYLYSAERFGKKSQNKK
jgi:hypothetical protein